MPFSIFMYIQRKLSTKQLTLQRLCFCLLLCMPVCSYAGLEELDDQKLDEQTAKAGLTIDLAFKLSIKEILFDYSDNGRHADHRKTTLTPPPSRIEYIHGND